ncbi:MAG TPA: hypothetical protein VGA78_12500, partial [Gemmatimonadales bacterium]
MNVRPPRRWLEALEVTPNSVTLEVGGSQAFSAQARWNDGGTQKPQVVWSATGGTINSEGWFTAGSATGNHKVIARDKLGTLADTAFVSVREPTMVGLDVRPASADLAPDANLQFTATARMSNGELRSVGASWSATGGSVTSQGLYTAPHGAGTYFVAAAVTGTGFADTAAVTVSIPQATLTQLVLNPSSVQVPAGLSRQFAVSALYSDGSTRTPPVQWSATGGSITSGGLYTAGAVQGPFRVVALEPASGKADTSAVQVSSPGWVTLSLSPNSGTLLPGETLQFSTTGQLSDGSSGTASVIYSAAGGTISTGGLYTAGSAAGTFQVIARDPDGTVADTSLVTIGALEPVLTDIELWPASIVLPLDALYQFQVTGTWTNGGTSKPSVTYSATGGTILSYGVYRAPTTPGTYRVFATQTGGTLRDTSVVTVTTAAATPTLTAIAVSPATVTLSTGATQQFTASGTWSDGSTTPPAVTWSASGGTVTSGGLYAAPATPGTYQVTATQTAGTLSASAPVTVQSGVTLVGVVLSPDSTTLQSGATKQFSAVGRYSDGSTSPASPNYSATGGSITANGLYTAGGTGGTFRVIAVTGGFADTSVVIIQTGGPPTLVGIDVVPSSLAMFTGGGQQFSASGRFSDGSTGPVSVTWTATGGVVTSAGLYTAGTSAGTFRVLAAATVGSKADTAVVTITQAPPPGQYQTLFKKDWSTYADETALNGVVWVENHWNDLLEPKLPATDFYDLVPDPIFGKVVRYLGAVRLNSYPLVVEAVNPGTAGNLITIT